MGIQSFTTLFPPQEVIKSMSHFKGMVMIVDGSAEVYRALKGMHSINSLTSASGERTQHINTLFANILERRRNGISETWIFDNKEENIYKKDELDARRRARKEQAAKAELIVVNSAADLAKLTSYEKAAASITEEDFMKVKMLLDFFGIRWADAPKNVEAEKVCGHIANSLESAFVLTGDSDTLVYGARRVIMRSNLHGKLYLYHLEEMLEKFGINQEELIKIAIFLGTDHNKGGRKGVGPVKVMNMFRTATLTDAEAAVYELFVSPVPVDELVWHDEKENIEELVQWLVVDLSFNEARVLKLLNKKK